MTTRTLFRLSGIAAMAAGAVFAGIQPIHPQDVLASVTTSAWALITPVKTIMCLLFLLGIAGIYARQAERAGWLGLAGFLLLWVSWALNLSFIFLEAFVMPVLAKPAPAVVEGLLGLINGQPTGADLGAVPALIVLTGITYMLGGLLFGIATLRAGILPGWPGLLLAVAATLTPLAGLLPHETQRLAGMPVGFALAWLGFALWTERREPAVATVPSTVSLSLQ